MYICPICNKEFNKEEDMVKHLSSCWKKHNPNHKSNPAPRGEDITTKEIEDNVLDFFNSFNKEDK